MTKGQETRKQFKLSPWSRALGPHALQRTITKRNAHHIQIAMAMVTVVFSRRPTCVISAWNVRDCQTFSQLMLCNFSQHSLTVFSHNQSYFGWPSEKHHSFFEPMRDFRKTMITALGHVHGHDNIHEYTTKLSPQLKATLHTRLRARGHYTSSTLIGGEGGAGPSSLHTTLEGPTKYVNTRWM